MVFIVVEFAGRGDGDKATVVEANNEKEAIEIFISHNSFFEAQDFEDGEFVSIVETTILRKKS